jgi:hypothetical protein
MSIDRTDAVYTSSMPVSIHRLSLTLMTILVLGGLFAAPAPAGSAFTSDVQADVEQIKQDTAAFRNLRPKRPVRTVFLTSEQLRGQFQADAAQASPATRQRDNVQFWLMRLSDTPTYDVLDVQTQALGEDVLGFYRFSDKTMYIRTDTDVLSPRARITLAHEYTHALQDQYYNLSRLSQVCNPRGVCDSDRALAIRALVEGDATITGFTYGQRRLTGDELRSVFGSGDGSGSGGGSALPTFFQQLVAFPYVQGSEFVIELVRARDGYSAVDRALRDTPVSTEQILHPEKYLSRPRDLPKPVTLPDVARELGAGWRMTDNTNLGELGIRAWFAQLGAPDAAAVGAGWGGDRFQFFQKDEAAVLVIATRWDTETDATEYVANITDRMAAAGVPQTDGIWNDGARIYALSRNKDRISLIAGNDLAAVQRTAAFLTAR